MCYLCRSYGFQYGVIIFLLSAISKIYYCMFICYAFLVYKLFSFYFYTYVPHWYVSFYAAGLAECVSFLIMCVLKIIV
jgi:hypothetical protein